MRYASACNRIGNTHSALDRAIEDIRSQLDGRTPDLAFLFVSSNHGEAEYLGLRLQHDLGVRHLIGCTAEAVIGTGVEVESGSALSLWCAAWEGVPLRSFHVTCERTPDGILASGFPAPEDLDFVPSALFLLGDPFSCPPDSIIERVETDYPGLPLMGGMASGGRGPGTNALFSDNRRLDEGAVGVLIGPGVPIHSLVSQGCRPVGERFLVTKAERNVIFELGGKPALDRLGEVFSGLSPNDRELLQRGPHLGIAMNEYQAEFRRGDFLISNVLGGDKSNGAMAIGNLIRVGQTVQFHVRDAETADEDLRAMLIRTLTETPMPAAGLLFSCNGRGTRMFPEPHHDAKVVAELAGPIPLAGLFAQGELGPVAGRNHIHGFTASLALFGNLPTT